MTRFRITNNRRRRSKRAKAFSPCWRAVNIVDTGTGATVDLVLKQGQSYRVAINGRFAFVMEQR